MIELGVSVILLKIRRQKERKTKQINKQTNKQTRQDDKEIILSFYLEIIGKKLHDCC